MLIGYLQDIAAIFRTHRVMHTTLNKSSACLIAVIYMLLLAGCTSPGATLKVKPQHEAGIQYSPQEISRMMDILGYDRLPIRDPDTRQPVAIATVNGQYRMLFQFRENASIRVDAHIVIGHGAIGLHLYQPGSEGLDNAAVQQYDKLKQRLLLQYGAEHVSDSHPAFTP